MFYSNHFEIPLPIWIIIHISYREVFNAAVKVADLKQWLGLNPDEQGAVDTSINSLVEGGHLVHLNGYIARAGCENYILQQAKKSEKAKQIIESGLPLLKKLQGLKFIKFIGVSGSVAADNPVSMIEGTEKGHTDLDLYVITASNTMWLFVFFEHLTEFFRKRFHKRHFFCFNYVTEENFLEITNKNFFTATEFINLKPLTGDLRKQKILSNNQWIKKFYVIDEDDNPPVSDSRTPRLLTKAINWLLFRVYFLTSTFKRLDFAMIRRSRKKHNPHFRHNFKRVCSPIGGYELVIARKFVDLFQLHFPTFYDESIVNYLFPNELEVSEHKKGNLSKAKKEFIKYQANAESTI